jgi:predicted MPP superfamily phosphohydrolase
MPSIHDSRTRRRRILGGLLAAGAGAGGWMRFVEPFWTKVVRERVTLPFTQTGGRPLRLLHLSDFHADPMPLDHIASAITAGLAEKPDLICLTGDFITWKYDRWDEYAAILKPLAAAAPAFAILGNHDGGGWARHSGYPDTSLVRSLLERAGISLLHNRRTELDIAGRKLVLAGLGDWWADEVRPAEAFDGWRAQPGVPVVLMSHNPDTKDQLAAWPWNLMLCGHTHGGQLSLPLIGEPFAPIRDKRFVRGLHRWQGRWLHITAGVGALHSLRFNCRPEISLLELSPA